jgi:hypothetical protein
MPSFTGAWDLTIHRPSGSFPSWFEITDDGGRYVGIWGSARPITSIFIEDDRLDFELASQYEGIEKNLRFELTEHGNDCYGFAWIWDDEPYAVIGRRAPAMERTSDSVLGKSIDLLAGGMDGFSARWEDKEFNWSMVDGVLVNSAVGTDLITKEVFGDFRLNAEYTYPAGSNSGIYLRGRYEFQILDDFGQLPSVGSSAAIYGFFAPLVNAIHAPNEWNQAIIDLRGRHVTVDLNGIRVLDEVIPGITGGAMDSDEHEPGCILLQGDHGPVSFRKLVLTPIA